MTPVERLRLAGVAKLRSEYRKQCDMGKKIVSQKFRYHKNRSESSSVRVFANQIGLPTDTLNHILRCDSLPSAQVLEEALQKCEFMYGEASIDVLAIHKEKLKKAVALSLQLTGYLGLGHGSKGFLGLETLQAPDRAVTEIADVVDSVVPPSHSTYSHEGHFDVWTKEVWMFEGQQSQLKAHALGTFFAVREYLSGFHLGLLRKSQVIAKDETSHPTAISNAKEVLVDGYIVCRVLSCFQSYANSPHSLLRNLSRVLQTDISKAGSVEETINSELAQFGLTYQDFMDPNACEGYLLMQSSVFRPRVLKLLSDTKQGESKS